MTVPDFVRQPIVMSPEGRFVTPQSHCGNKGSQTGVEDGIWYPYVFAPTVVGVKFATTVAIHSGTLAKPLQFGAEGWTGFESEGFVPVRLLRDCADPRFVLCPAALKR